jgi:hypothetical protein
MNGFSSVRMLEAKSATKIAGCNHINKWKAKRVYSLKKTFIILISIALISMLNPLQVLGQTSSMVPTAEQKHSPHKATIYSAILPGLGQAYNKKYWKIPIIYGGLGALAYMTRENTLEYRKFLEAYRYVVSDETTPPENDYIDRYTEQQLLSGKNLYLRNVEVGYILGGVLYILNIIDATVDAHLFYYDISEDLSMKLEPAMLSNPLAAKPVSGLSLTLRF